MLRKSISAMRICVSAPAVAFALLGASAPAQTTAVATPRVLTAVQPSARVTLKGNTHPLARPQYDRGPLPDSTPAGHMVLVLKRSPEQQQALDRLVAAQQDPHSPSYHKWLTPEAFGSQFGVADADIQSVTGYLASQGFSVARVFKNKSAIEFSGTTGQIRQAFNTQIHTFAVNGRQFHANASDPQIPAALAPVIAGISSLNDFKSDQPLTTQQFQYDPATHRARPLYSDPVNAGTYAVTPGDLAKIYDIPAGLDGTGVTVGVVGQSNINLSILANYRTTFGLPANAPSVIVDGADPGVIPGAELAYEQIELIAAAAPAAKVNYYVSSSSDPALFGSALDFASVRAVEDNAVQVLSFGAESCEAALGVAGNLLYGSLWQQAAAQGITVVVSAGSSGSAACDVRVNNAQPVAATQGLAVSGYASTPYATAVGATDFYYAPGTSQANYWSSTNGGTDGYTSALGYVPEQAFNASYIATNQTQNVPEVLAGGGGLSTLGVITPTSDPNVFLQTPWPRPYWQLSAASNIPTTSRVVPDVSLFGGALLNGSIYALCIGATDCVGGSPGTLIYSGGGVTNGATAAFAGIASLIVQSKGVQGNINPILYSVAALAPSAFHDVTTGTNTVDCTTGSPSCAGGYLVDSLGNLAYPATAGFDAATGLGSVDVANLIANWNNPATQSSAVTLTLTQPNTNLPITSALHHGDPVQVNVTVSGSSGTPTGVVAVYTNSPLPASATQDRLTLSNGTAVDNDLTTLPGGTYQLFARYAGDASFTPSVSAPITVTVFQVASSLNVLEQNFQAGATLPYGAPVSLTLAPTAANNPDDIGTPTGAVTISDNGKTLTIAPLNAYGLAMFSTSSLVPGNHSLFATYSGDASYSSTSLLGPINFVVAQAATATSLTASTTTVSSSNSGIDLIANVSATTAGTTGFSPSGAVKFTSGTTTLGQVSVVPVLGGSASATSVASLRIKASALGKGTSSIVATFSSYDNNYAGSVSAPLSVTNAGVGGLAATTTNLASIPLGATQFFDYSNLSFNVNVTGGGATPTGSVAFFANGNSLGSAPLVAGAVVFPVPVDANANLAMPLGGNVVTAQYSGDATHGASNATYKLTILDDTTAPDFSLQTNQVYQTVTPSVTTATFQLQFTSLRNFTAAKRPITLSYVSDPGFKCSGSPARPNFNSTNYASITVTCSIAPGFTGPLSKLEPVAPHRWWVAGGGAALACVFLFGIPARRRRWQSLLGTLLVVIVACTVSGCGAANMSSLASMMSAKADAQSGVKKFAAQPLSTGTYNVLVSASAQILTSTTPNTTTTVVHTLPLKIVVQ